MTKTPAGSTEVHQKSSRAYHSANRSKSANRFLIVFNSARAKNTARMRPFWGASLAPKTP